MRDLSVIRINSTTFGISFTSPSSPNRIIDHYEIDVSNVLDMPPNFTVNVDNNNSKTTNQIVTTITGLCEYLRLFIPLSLDFRVHFYHEYYSLIFTLYNAVECVPYYITVYAVNQMGRGPEAEDIDFTQECSK